jgi:hypothetical protein
VILLALELVSGRREIWLPRRWARLWLGGPARRRFLHLLLVLIRRLERVSPPRLRFRFDHWLSNVLFGSLVAAGSIGALLAPPFSALDTLPALGAVLVSLGVLLEDVAVVAVGSLAGAAGVALEVVLASAALRALATCCESPAGDCRKERTGTARGGAERRIGALSLRVHLSASRTRAGA